MLPIPLRMTLILQIYIFILSKYKFNSLKQPNKEKLYITAYQMAIIRSIYHLTEDDYRFIALDYAGFSTRAISIIMGTSVDAIYARRSRIKKVM